MCRNRQNWLYCKKQFRVKKLSRDRQFGGYVVDSLGWFVAGVQNAGYFPEAVLNLITNIGAGFTVRETAGMDMNQLIAHVSNNTPKNIFLLYPSDSVLVYTYFS